MSAKRTAAQMEEGQEEGRDCESSRVDRHDHALLAVHRLRAVQEHGLRVHDGDVEGAHHAARAAVEGDEAAVHPREDADGAVDGPAGRVREGLRHGVVARRELELEHVARAGGDAVRGEGQGGAADEYRDDLVVWRGGGGEGPGLAVDWERERRLDILIYGNDE